MVLTNLESRSNLFVHVHVCGILSRLLAPDWSMKYVNCSGIFSFKSQDDQIRNEDFDMHYKFQEIRKSPNYFPKMVHGYSNVLLFMIYFSLC